MIHLEGYNSSKVESAANTLTYENVEVPNSSGARNVHLVRAELDPDAPEYVAASDTVVVAIAILGKSTPTSVDLAQVGAITTKSITKFSTGAAQFAAVVSGPDQAQGRWEIPKNPSDGKYYFTIAVKGSNNVAAKYVRYRCDFEVEH